MGNSNRFVEKFALIVGAFILYLLAFRVNQSLDEYVIYAQGVALVFLPAGIKHIAILVGRYWGAIGCFFALAYVTPEFWPTISFTQALIYSGISTIATLVAIHLGMQVLKIHSDLNNLRFIHLPALDLITTTTHSFVTNAYFIADGMKVDDEYMGNALGMGLGDFVGSFILMMSLLAAIKLKKQFINS